MCLFYEQETKETLIINIGFGDDKKIIDYAKFVMKMLNYKVQIKFDKTKQMFPRKIIRYYFSKKIWLESED